jgi:uncharacterized membrane protein YgcG
MMSFYTITLFTEQSDLGPQPTSFAASIVVHSVAAAVIWFGLAYRPAITRVITEHDTVRELDLHMPDQQALAALARGAYSGAHSGTHAPASGGNPSPRRPVPRPIAEAKPGPQTLVQPDIPNPITLAVQIPMPQVMIWSPSKTVVKKVVPPLPEKPTASDVKPSLERPNEEMTLADVNIASSFHPSAKSIVPASTTSPVVIQAPQQVQLPPVTASQPSVQPTPAAIVSLSDLRLKNGTVALPPVNESAVKKTEGEPAPGQAQDLSSPDKNNSAVQSEQAGSGQGSSAKTNGAGSGSGQGSSAKTNGAGSGAGQGSSAKADNSGQGAGHSPQGGVSSSGSSSGSGKADVPGTTRGADFGLEPNGQLTVTQILLPKDGHFNSVVVGNSLQDQYPEVAGVWNGRMAYTVYLHVGQAKSWIMQYSLPRSADTAAAGTIVRLDAPWPYNIVRPNLDADAVDADAIMIHGFINQSGRFDTLSIVVPQAFPQAQFVLAALGKWQFRPALQDGQFAKVEVLIIIPEQLD